MTLITEMAKYIIGYDPGGKGNHGVALIKYGSKRIRGLKVSTCSSVEEAIEFVKEVPEGKNLVAAGIDTLLTWPRNGEWRSMDKVLRNKYPQVQGSVIHPCSLRGAMLINGIVMASELIKINKDIILNETHPKVHYYAERNIKYDFKKKAMVEWLLEQMGAGTDDIKIKNEHQYDALYSAWITYRAVIKREGDDLVRKCDKCDHNKLYFPLDDNVKYYWCEPI